MADADLRERNLDRAVHLASSGRIDSEHIVDTAKEFDGYINGTTSAAK